MAENPRIGFSQRNLRFGDSSLQFHLRSSEDLPQAAVIEAVKMSILTLRHHLYKAIRPASGFNVDNAPTSAAHTAELFAQVRGNEVTRGHLQACGGRRHLQLVRHLN
jgi:hypothetical protein